MAALVPLSELGEMEARIGNGSALSNSEAMRLIQGVRVAHKEAALLFKLHEAFCEHPPIWLDADHVAQTMVESLLASIERIPARQEAHHAG